MGISIAKPWPELRNSCRSSLIALYRFLHSFDIVERHSDDFSHNSIQAVLCEKRSHVSLVFGDATA